MDGRKIGGVTPKEEGVLEFSLKRVGVEALGSESGIKSGYLPADAGLVSGGNEALQIHQALRMMSYGLFSVVS